MNAEERHEAITTLAGRATADHLSAAVLLYKAYVERDWALLGLENWAAFIESVGVSKSADSKMRTAARVFDAQWVFLPETDRKALTLERLYQASRVAKRDGLSVEDGLALAVSTPSHVLVGLLRGEDADPKPVHDCPVCGAEHRVKSAVT